MAIRVYAHGHTRIGICVFRVCFGSLILKRYCKISKERKNF